MKSSLLAALIFAALLSAPTSADESRLPPKEVVADATTAIAIARAVLVPVYGEDQINLEEPLIAERQGGVWIVEGSAPHPEPSSVGPNERFYWVGGVAEVRLLAKDGRVLLLTHGQ